MAYKKGQDRRQRVLFPDCIDEYVEADVPVRLFDAFVDISASEWQEMETILWNSKTETMERIFENK